MAKKKYQGNVWKKGAKPKKKEIVIPRKKQEPQQSENHNTELTEFLEGKEPINEFHRILFFDNKLGKDFCYAMWTPFEAASKIRNPELITIEELISISGFLGINAIWLYCRIYAEYTTILSKSSKTKEQLSTRLKRAYVIQEFARAFRETNGHEEDSKKGVELMRGKAR